MHIIRRIYDWFGMSGINLVEVIVIRVLRLVLEYWSTPQLYSNERYVRSSCSHFSHRCHLGRHKSHKSQVQKIHINKSIFILQVPGSQCQYDVLEQGHAENLLKHIRLSIRDCALNCPNAHCRFNITSE